MRIIPTKLRRIVERIGDASEAITDACARALGYTLRRWGILGVAGALAILLAVGAGAVALQRGILVQAGFLQAGTGAVMRTGESKLRDVVSVKDFGAKCDGSTDDTAAIQAAINASPEVHFPAATCNFTALTLTTRSILIGATSSGSTQPPFSGTGGTILNSTVGTANTAILLANGSEGVRLENFTLVMPNQQSAGTTGVIGIDALTNTNSHTIIRNVTVQQGFIGIQIGGTYARLEDVTVQSPRYVGLDIYAATTLTVVGGLYANSLGWTPDGANIKVEGASVGVGIHDVFVDESFSAEGLVVLGADKVLIDNVRGYYAHGGWGIRLGNGTTNPTNCTIINANMTRFAAGAAPTAAIEVNGTGHTLINVSGDASADGGAGISDLGTGTVKIHTISNTVAAAFATGGTIAASSTAFASLGTPANGTLSYCSDCTIAATCAGSGTGALAKRLNSVWVCN